MSWTSILEYGRLRILDVEADAPEDWNDETATYIRATLPTSVSNMKAMAENGFFHADRILDVSINLRRSKVDFLSLVRLVPHITSNERDALLEIATESFPMDRRFNPSIVPDAWIRKEILSAWIAEIPEFYVCDYKEQPIGFLALCQKDDRSMFIHLAAVLEKYRMTGAALSLYAQSAHDCKKRGMHRLDGCISSQNTAVMNLYSFLGGVFSNPRDVYLKEAKCL